MEIDHSPLAIAHRLSNGPQQSYLRDWVYGGIDGSVTTFAIVSGVVGAELSAKTILILGFANLIADGFSMAAGNYLSTKAEHDEFKHLERLEHEEIRTLPEGEREEVRQIFRKKGFSGELLERAVATITSNKKQWVQLMLAEEHGLPPLCKSPLKAAMNTMVAFLLCGLIPLLPYLLKFDHAFNGAACATAAVFFAIGSLKSRWSVASWWVSGFETLAVGSASAALAYGVGVFCRGM